MFSKKAKLASIFLCTFIFSLCVIFTTARESGGEEKNRGDSPSISVNFQSIALDNDRVIISGEFGVKDMTGGNNKGVLIQMPDYQVDWEYKENHKAQYEPTDISNNTFEVNGATYSYNCIYSIVEIEGDTVDPAFPLGDDLSVLTPVVFDGDVKIGYICAVSNPIPNSGFIRGTARVKLPEKDKVFLGKLDYRL